MQYSQADSGCMLSGVRPIHPEIVGWSTAPRGQVINESLGQVPKKLVSRPARAGKDRIITDPIGYETGWTIARSLGEVGTTSVHSNPVFACNDCTFLDELHRATLEKKIIVGKCLLLGGAAGAGPGNKHLLALSFGDRLDGGALVFDRSDRAAIMVVDVTAHLQFPVIIHK